MPKMLPTISASPEAMPKGGFGENDSAHFVLDLDSHCIDRLSEFQLQSDCAASGKEVDCLRRQCRDQFEYPQWNRHASRATTEFEVATWSTWPGCSVGIVGGAIAALDIDVAEDGELALHIERLAREQLGDTPTLRIGKPPKRLLVYRTTEPFAGIRRAPLEVLCLGQQFVASAKHPDTG
jgi:hypothetical protein